MNISKLHIEGLLLIELDMYTDDRGFFIERYNNVQFKKHGLPTYFAQDNHSRSRPGVLRGLHFQRHPIQGKLVGVLHGRMQDVAVDIRPTSPTFGEYFSIELNDSCGKMLWIPTGFAHGFCVLGDEPADILYKVTAPYNAAGEGGITWNDRKLNIKWLTDQSPIISPRDRELPTFEEYIRDPIIDSIA